MNMRIPGATDAPARRDDGEDPRVDQEVADLRDLAAGPAVRAELERLERGQRHFFEALLNAGRLEPKWSQDTVAAVCAALGSMFAQLLWDADRNGHAALEVIADGEGPPVVRVTPHAESRLERRRRSLDPVTLDASEVASYIAPQCNLSVDVVQPAWEKIARELHAAADALPQVEVRASPSGVRVSLRHYEP